MPSLQFNHNTEQMLTSVGQVAAFFNLVILFIAGVTFIALGINVGRGGKVPEEIKRAGLENVVRKSWMIMVIFGIFVLFALFRVSRAVISNKNFAGTIGLLTLFRFFF